MTYLPPYEICDMSVAVLLWSVSQYVRLRYTDYSGCVCRIWAESQLGLGSTFHFTIKTNATQAVTTPTKTSSMTNGTPSSSSTTQPSPITVNESTLAPVISTTMSACNRSTGDGDHSSLTAAQHSSLLASRLSLKSPLSLTVTPTLSIVTPPTQAPCSENVLRGKRVLVLEQKTQVATIVSSYLSRWEMTPVRFII